VNRHGKLSRLRQVMTGDQNLCKTGKFSGKTSAETAQTASTKKPLSTMCSSRFGAQRENLCVSRKVGCSKNIIAKSPEMMIFVDLGTACTQVRTISFQDPET
jgi:hypothetical protein